MGSSIETIAVYVYSSKVIKMLIFIKVHKNQCLLGWRGKGKIKVSIKSKMGKSMKGWGLIVCRIIAMWDERKIGDQVGNIG